jgi:hypothetical protein
VAGSGAALLRPLSIAGDIRRARVGQDRTVLVDLNAAPVRALPREERELMIAANNGYLLAFDNLSGLPAWLSDALCRLATGGSFAVGQLYTNDDEVLFQAARPLLVNGIEDVIRRADLADRGIFLTLAPIREQQRRSEDLWREFEIARRRILGALLDAAVRGYRGCPVFVSRACRGWPTSPSGPRLAEQRCGPRAPLRAPTDTNRIAAVEGSIEADPVAVCVRKFMAERGSWAVTPSDLCVSPRSLSMTMSRKQTRARQKIPAHSPAGFGAQTFLRVLGIEISYSRGGEQERGRLIIRCVPGWRTKPPPSAPSAPFTTTSR